MLEPKVEVAIGVQPQDGFAQKPFELDQELVDLWQFLAGVGKEIVDIEFGMVLAHVDGQRRAVAAARQTQNMPLRFAVAHETARFRFVVVAGSAELAVSK